MFIKKMILIVFVLLVAASSYAITVNYELSIGWNLIAVPCSTGYENITDFLPVIAAFSFNSDTRDYVTITAPPSHSSGFWVLSEHDTSISITCTCIDDCECVDNEGLPDSLFCKKQIGECEACGVIFSVPTGCYEIYAPVCGCDGITYDNDCYAWSYRVNILHEGPCCECMNNDGLAPGQYCNKEDGDCDGCGEVADRPTACPDVWDPVCGCDDETYGNSCEAAAAGQNIQYRGECH